MSIDELLHDTMRAEVAEAPAPTDAGWSAVTGRAHSIERRRQRKRLAAVALGAAAVLLIGLIVARGGRGLGGDNLFVGDPTTTIDLGPGPEGAANVEDTVATAADGAAPVGFSSPRIGIDDRELIVFVPLETATRQDVSCGTGLAAEIRTTPIEVVVTLRRGTEPSTNPCQTGVDQLALRVTLPEPLGRRFVTDGSQFPNGYGTPFDPSVLLVPGGLPNGYTAQVEQDVYGWAVCYAASRDTCELGQGPLVQTTMDRAAGELAIHLGLPDELGRAGSAQARSPTRARGSATAGRPVPMCAGRSRRAPRWAGRRPWCCTIRARASGPWCGARSPPGPPRHDPVR